MRIGILDCETLSLNTNAIVYEVGLLVFECDRHYTLTSELHSYTSRLDILEQLALGRDASPDTLEFQNRTFGVAEFRRMVYGSNLENPIREASEVLNTVSAMCKGLKELWIFKPSFDYSVLHSLAEDLGMRGDSGLWPHMAEFDLRTVYKKLGLSKPVTATYDHKAMKDCLWNLEILKTFGAKLKHIEKLELLYAERPVEAANLDLNPGGELKLHPSPTKENPAE